MLWNYPIKIIKELFFHLRAFTVGMYILIMLSTGSIFLLGAGLLQIIPLRMLQNLGLEYTNFVNRGVSKLLGISFILTNSSYQIKGSLDIQPDFSNENTIFVSNHISWSDSFFIQYIPKWRAFHRKFIYKIQLQKMPFIGAGLNLINFIPVDRIKHKKDITITEAQNMRNKFTQRIRKITNQFKDGNYAVVIYAEGTRYTAEKSIKDKSCDYLLTPRAGGFTQVLMNLQNVKRIVDITVTYGTENYSLWQWMGGRNPKCHLEVAYYALPKNLLDAVQANDEKTTLKLSKIFLKSIWQDKQKRIAQAHETLNNEQALKISRAHL